jgi:hypothetical protein
MTGYCGRCADMTSKVVFPVLVIRRDNGTAVRVWACERHFPLVFGHAEPNFFRAIGFLFDAMIGGIDPESMDVAYHAREAADVIRQTLQRYEGRQLTGSQEGYLRTGREIVAEASARLGLG